MRSTFAHEAALSLDPDGDERAPGGAVTIALCGSWEHPGPCPVAPHHTGVERDGDDLVVRVLFACAPEDEAGVRAVIVEALGEGELVGPDGLRTRWTLTRQAPSTVLPDEEDRAAALALAP